ncbi:endonuclease [Polymorphobacter glacialis]|uniref:Endonuclease n=1 Tax=Sandarakinorhabdus glacialis TaxID=1614636 RepID=A0A917EB83_9SPHN|nr:DNA/RNA non-specific endonuclease [Polymorphobacter glacialis]GGE20989.1 endonuclease [Polymorphobacter glacialis]
MATNDMAQDLDVKQAALDVAIGAAERWQARAGVREDRARALGEGRYLDADSPDRVAARINRLAAGARRAGLSPTMAAETLAPTAMGDPPASPAAPPVTPQDLTSKSVIDQRMIVEEALIGVQNFLSIEFLERGVVAARTVGCVVFRSGGGPRALGSGFLVAPGILLTNNHVLPRPDRADGCSIQMDYVNDFGPGLLPQLYQLEPDRIFVTDKDLDYTLVAVAAVSDRGKPIADYGWNPLDGGFGKITTLPEDFLNIVQHPLGRRKEVVLRDNRILDLRTSATETAAAAMTPFIHYEADTEHGSSGSPVFNDQWEVVALHHMGVPQTDAEGRFLNKAGGVWDRTAEPLESIAWVGNEGIRVSSLVTAFTSLQLQGEARTLLALVLAGAGPGSANAAATIAPAAAHPAGSNESSLVGEAPPEADAQATGIVLAAENMSFEIPLRVTIAFGNGRGIGTPAPVERSPEATEPMTPAASFAGRDGYRPDFLGVAVPLPVIKPRPVFGTPLPLTLPPLTGNPCELRYARYSVIMNARRRLAYLSAANVDFAAITAPRSNSDKWARDGRIPAAMQVGNDYYLKNDYDKGHLTRRADAAWGATLTEAVAANADTFHYTNAAPQHKFFNQSDAFTHQHLKLWGDLEDFIAAQGQQQRTRLTIFNGPIFAGNDKPLKDILVPRAFFKIVVWHDDGEAEAGAVGFVLEQSDLIARLPEEAIDAGEFRLRQRLISAIQTTVDLDFGELARLDRLAGAPTDRLHEVIGASGDRPIEALTDIIC